MAMENGPFVNDFPTQTSIHGEFSSQPCLMKQGEIDKYISNVENCHTRSAPSRRWHHKDVEDPPCLDYFPAKPMVLPHLFVHVYLTVTFWFEGIYIMSMKEYDSTIGIEQGTFKKSACGIV